MPFWLAILLIVLLVFITIAISVVIADWEDKGKEKD